MGFERVSGGIPPVPVAPRPVRLMEEVRRCLRLKHYSLRTEQAYIGWIRRFILANDKRHPRDEVQRDFLSFIYIQKDSSIYVANYRGYAFSYPVLHSIWLHCKFRILSALCGLTHRLNHSSCNIPRTASSSSIFSPNQFGMVVSGVI